MLERQNKKLLKFKDVKKVLSKPYQIEKSKKIQKEKTKKTEEEKIPSTVKELQEELKKARREARRWKEVYNRYHRITHGN